MKTDLEYRQCEDYYKEIIKDKDKKIEELEDEIRRLRKSN